MESTTILQPKLTEQFHTALAHGRMAFFTAPCGFGKTTAARALLKGRAVYALRASEAETDLPLPGRSIRGNFYL